MRTQEHIDHCKSIAERLQQVVNGELFTDDEGNEWEWYYDASLGYDAYQTHEWERTESGECVKRRVTLTTEDGYTYIKSDDGAIIEDVEEYLQPFGLSEYFEGGIYNVEYRVPNRDDDPSSVCVMVACGGPNVYLDTKSGDVELYWWNEAGSYPMGHVVACAIDKFMNELYWC